MNKNESKDKPKVYFDILLFFTGSILTFLTVYKAIPILSEKAGIMQLAAWMFLSIPFVFFPIILAGFFILRSEQSKQNIFKRIRLRKLTKSDWKWTLIGLVGMTLGSGITFFICNVLLKINPNPPFSQDVEAWTNGHLWMFGLWFFYWPINILGEGLVWRGIILPRMEQHFGGKFWYINSILWGVFHWSFGLGNLIVLLPTLIFVPYITQKTQNTWTGIILHATLSGLGFIALAFGLMK